MRCPGIANDYTPENMHHATIKAAEIKLDMYWLPRKNSLE
jgi:hypothetical protein